MSSVEIHEFFKIVVDYDYIPAIQSRHRDDPDEPEEFDIRDITLNGHSIHAMLTKPQLDDIEAEVRDQINYADDGDVDLPELD